MKRIDKILLIFVALLWSVALGATDGGGGFSSFAPYSIYGIGDMHNMGSAYNLTMGGVGIASRNNRYINSLNPAAVTARDSLAFMSDFSVYQKNNIYRQGSAVSASNVFNINDIIISFPLFPHTAMMVGIKPYSSSGYQYSYYENKPGVTNEIGTVNHLYSGQGSMFQAFAAAGITLFKNLSLGAEYIHYFGNTKKNYNQTVGDAASLAASQATEMVLSSNTVKFGIQYDQPIADKYRLCLGATYKLNSRLSGFSNSEYMGGNAVLISRSDTLANLASPVNLASEAGLGIAFVYGRKFRAEFDYIYSDWSNSNFEKNWGFSVNGASGEPVFRSCASHSFRAGVEWIPNPGDIRYYHNLIAYRAGVYYTRDNFSISGNPVYSRGITLGATLPIFQWYNGLTVGLELGQRGSLKNNLIRETYIGFSLGVNLFDIWFQQYRYE